MRNCLNGYGYTGLSLIMIRLFPISVTSIFSAYLGFIQLQSSNSVFQGANLIEPGSCGKNAVPMEVQQTGNAGARIVGGVNARPHSIPSIVSIRKFRWILGGMPYCGGTLISAGSDNETDIVLSAAHCFGGKNLTNPSISVRAGAHLIVPLTSPGERTVRVARVIIHPGYDNLTNDIAIVKLAHPIAFSNTIQPICLPKQFEYVEPGSKGIVAGWGYSKDKGWIMDQMVMMLKQVVVEVIDELLCHWMVAGYKWKEMICAGFIEGKKDSCRGDSGGPLIMERNGSYVLQGIVNFGRGCAQPRAPGVYARVSTYVDWIKTVVADIRSLNGY